MTLERIRRSIPVHRIPILGPRLSGLKRRALRLKARLGQALFETKILLQYWKIRFFAPKDGLIVFFSPLGVKQYLDNTYVFAHTLRNKGYRVLFVVCNETMNQCLLMGMRSNTERALSLEEKKTFCTLCTANIRAQIEARGFDFIDMNILLGDAAKAEITRRLDAYPDLASIEWDGKKLADLSLIDLALLYKQRRLDSPNPAMQQMVKDYVYSTIFAYESIKRLSQLVKISSLVFNGDYTVHLTASLAAQKVGARSIAVGAIAHRLADLGRNVMYPDLWEIMHYKYYEEWPRWRELAVPEKIVHETAEDLLLRWKPKDVASAVYSPPLGRKPVSWRERFNVPPKAKLLVAYTSSVDEAISTQKALEVWQTQIPKLPQPYNDQITWLKDLVDFVKGKDDDLFLIVRIHPREGKNSVDKIESEHLFDLRREFQGKTPPNVRIVWPEDEASSYELGEEADLVLVSWSNIGLELARVGVPVLASMIRITCLPFDDFVVRVPDRSTYYQKVMEMLDQPARLETILRAYRWYQLSRLGGTVDFSDVKPAYNSEELYPFDLPQAHQTMEDVIVKGTSIIDINHRVMFEGAQEPDRPARERQALLEELCRVTVFIMSGRIVTTIEAVRLVEGLSHQGHDCRYREGGTEFRRYSALVARLADLLAKELPRFPRAQLENVVS